MKTISQKNIRVAARPERFSHSGALSSASFLHRLPAAAALLAALAVSLAAPRVYATNYTWVNTTGTDWNTAADWNTGNFPGAAGTTDVAIFTGNEVVNANLSGTVSIGQLQFTTTGTNYTISSSPGKSLTIGSGSGSTTAITAANTSGTNTISASIVLGENANATVGFTQAAGGTLVISGNMSSTNAIAGISFNTNSTNAIYVLSGSNTYNGNTALAFETLDIANAHALGSGTLTFSNNGRFDNTSGGALTMANGIGIFANAATINFLGSNALTFTGSSSITQNGQAINVTGSSALTLSGVMNWNTTQTQKSGTGTLVLNGANIGTGATVTIGTATSYVSTFRINAGTVVVGNNSAFSTGVVDIRTGTLQSNTSVNLANNFVVATGSPTIGGSNALQISGSFIVNNGAGNPTLNITNTAATTLGAVFLSDSGTANETLTINVAATSGTATVSGSIANSTVATTGTDSLIKAGAGTLTLTGSSTYTGSTAIQAGALQIGSGGNLSSSTPVTIGSGTNSGLFVLGNTGGAVNQTLSSLVVAGTGTANAVVGGASSVSTLTINNTGTASYAGTFFGGSGTNQNNLALTVAGTGTTTLTGVNTYTGTTSVTGGKLIVGGTGSINGSTRIVINGGGATFVQTSSVASTPAVTLTQGRLDGTGTVGAVTVASGTGGIVTNGNGGTGTLSIGSLTFSGTGTVNINYGGSAAIATGTLVTTPANGQVTINGSGIWAVGLNNLISFGTFGGSITDFTTGSFAGLTSRDTSATLALNGNNIALNVVGDSPVWTGTASGIWTTGVTGTVGATPNWALKNGHTVTDFWAGDVAEFDDTYVVGSSTLTPNTNVQISGTVGPTATVFNNNSLSYVITGSNGSSGIVAGSLTMAGSGTTTLGGSNSYTGVTNVNAGTLILTGSLNGTPITTGTGGTFTENATGLVSGASSLNNSGITNISGSNTYTGATNVNAGTLNLTNGGSLNGTLITVGASGTFIEDSASVIGGASSFTDGGNATLSGSNTYTGATTINGAGLSVGVIALGGTTSSIGASSNAAANLVFSTGTFIYTGVSGTTDRSFTINSGTSTFTINNAATNLTISGSSISTSGALVLNGPGTLTLSGHNQHTGGTIVNSGTLVLATGGGVGALQGALTINPGAVVDLTSGDALGFTAGSTVTTVNINGGIIVDLSGNEGFLTSYNLTGGTMASGTGNGSYNFSPSGTLPVSITTLSSTATSIISAPLTLRSTTPLTFNVASGSAPGGIDLQVSGVIGVNGGNAIIKSGSGTMLFSSASPLIGVTVNAGTFDLTGTLGGPADSVASGAIFSESATGVISGSASLTNSGNSTLLGINTYTGTTTISSGTLQLGDGSSGHDGTLASQAIVDNASLVYAYSGSNAYAGIISGTGSVLLTGTTGTGSLTLTGSSTHTGVVTISAGNTLQLGNGTVDGSIASGTVSNGGGLIFATAGNRNLAGKITGNGTVTMNGTGNQRISGANNYTGATLINSGTLQLGSATALGNTSNVTVNSGAALNVSNGLSTQVVTLTTSSGITLTLNSGASLDFGVTNTATDELVLQPGATASANGTITINLGLLSGTITNSGTFTILSAPGGGLTSGGATYVPGTIPAFSGASLSVTDTTLQVIFNPGSVIPTVWWTGSGTNNAGFWSDFSNFSSSASGSPALTETFGAGQDLVFSASGAINQTFSIVDYNAAAKSLTINDPASVYIDSFSSFSLTLSGSGITTGSGAGAAIIGQSGGASGLDVILSGTPNITVNNAGGLSIGAVISGSNGIIVNGTNTLSLTGSNNYAGGTLLKSGTLNIIADNNLGLSGSGNGVTFNPGAGNSATLQSGTTTLTTAGNRTFVFNSGTGVIDVPVGDVLTIGGALSGAGALNKTSLGTLTLTGASTAFPAVTVSSGTLNFAGSLGGAASMVVNNAGGTFIETSGGALVGSSNFTNAGGISYFFGNNTTTGVVTINSGTLQLGNGTAGNDGLIAGSIQDNTSLVVDYSGSNTYGGVISGSGNVLVTGTGTLRFNANQSYTGGTIVNAGTLVLNAGGGTAVLQGTLTINPGATVNLTSNNALGFSIGLQTTTVNINGGTLLDNGGQEGFGTNFILTGGTMAGTNTTGFQTSGTFGITTLSSSAASVIADTVNMQGGPLVFNVASGSAPGGIDLLVSGSITGGGNAIQKTGAGTMALTGTSTYTGATTISAGTLQMGNGNAGSDPTISSASIVDNASLAYDISGSSSYGGNISGTGNVAVTGTGSVALTGSNTFTGTTNVTGGNLILSGTGSINNSSGILINGSGARFVQTSSVTSTAAITLTLGSLDGTGRVGAVTVTNGTGGILTNGNGSTGTLTVGSLSFNGAGTVNVNYGGSYPIVVTGALATTPGNGQVTINGTGVWTSGTDNLIGYGSFGGNISDFTLGTISTVTSRQQIIGTPVLVNTGSSIALSINVNGDSPVWTGTASGVWTTGVTGTVGATPDWALASGHTPTDFWAADIVAFNDTYVVGSSTLTPNAAVLISGTVGPTSTTFNNNSVAYVITGSNGSSGIVAGSLTLNGTSSVTLGAVNSYTGPTNVNAGTLNLTGTLNGTPIVVASGAAFSESATGAINGPASLASNGNSVLSGVNTYTGTTAIGGGGSLLINGFGSLGVSGTYAGAITNNGTFTFSSSGNQTLSGPISGTGTLVLNGSTNGTPETVGSNGVDTAGVAQTPSLTLTGSNSYSGGTIINGGVLSILPGTASGLGTGTITINGGFLEIGTFSLGNNIVLQGGGIFTGNASDTLSGTLTINAGSTTSYIANTYDHKFINITGPVVGSGNVTLTHTTLTDTGFPGANIQFSNSGSSSYNGTITINQDSTTSGTSWTTLYLGASNALANATINVGNAQGNFNNGDAGAPFVFSNGITSATIGGLSSGTATSAFGNVALQNTGGGALALSVGNNNTNQTYSGVLSGSGSLIKIGTGTQTLTGANTYAGVTTINNGNLSIRGVNSGAGAINVTPNAGAGATLSGTGTLVGAVTTAAASGLNIAHIGPGVGGVGTLTLNGGLTIGNGTDLDFTLGTSQGLIAVGGQLTLGSGVVLNVTQGGGFASDTIYNLLTYTGALTNTTSGWTATGGPGGTTAVFASGSGVVTVDFVTVTGNGSTLAITPSPISLGSVLVGSTPASASGTLTAGSGTGNATYTITSSGSASASGTGTLAPNASVGFTVNTTGTIGGSSGNGVVIGTVGASNSSNVSGSAGPVNVTANVFQVASLITPASTNSGSSTAALLLTSGSSTDGGQRAGVTVTGFSTSSANFQATVTNSGTVGVATNANVTATVGTLSVAPNRLNGTYNYSGSVTGTTHYTDAALASQGSVTSPVWNNVTVTATVTGNASNARSNVFSAQILSGSSYAGYSLSSSVSVTTHTNTGPGGSTQAQLLAGTASGTATVSMSFDSTPVAGTDNPFRTSDILTLTGINPTGSNARTDVTLTDAYVLQMNYDQGASGIEYIGQNLGNGSWFNAIAQNSNNFGNIPSRLANNPFVGSYSLYLSTPTGSGGGQGLTLAQQIQNDAYGYDPSNHQAWAVLDHTAYLDPISEFAVIPEPSTYALIFGGFGMLIGFRRLRRRLKIGKMENSDSYVAAIGAALGTYESSKPSQRRDTLRRSFFFRRQKNGGESVRHGELRYRSVTCQIYRRETSLL